MGTHRHPLCDCEAIGASGAGVAALLKANHTNALLLGVMVRKHTHTRILQCRLIVRYFGRALHVHVHVHVGILELFNRDRVCSRLGGAHRCSVRVGDATVFDAAWAGDHSIDALGDRGCDA